MKKIKILYIVPSLRICNGVASYAINYFKNINTEIIHIDFITGLDEESIYYNEIREKGSKIYYIPKITFKNFWQSIKQIKNFFKENKYDIIHCHVLNMGVFYMYFAKKYGVKTRILHNHSTKSADKKINQIRNDILVPLVVKNANKYCACSQMAGDAMFKNKKYNVINNAINIEKFEYNQEIRDKIRKLENIKDEYIIGNVGRFVPVKNQLFLLDIFIEYLKINENSKLMLIGGGILEDQIIEKIINNKLEDKVIIKKSITNVNEYLQAMDIFVLPSLYEGLPVVGVEAQASGLPCLFANTVTEEIKLIDDCEFVELDNMDKWINSIEKIRKNYKRKNQTENIKKKGYDIKTESLRLEEYYKDIIKNKGW